MFNLIQILEKFRNEAIIPKFYLIEKALSPVFGLILDVSNLISNWALELPKFLKAFRKELDFSSG